MRRFPFISIRPPPTHPTPPHTRPPHFAFHTVESDGRDRSAASDGAPAAGGTRPISRLERRALQNSQRRLQDSPRSKPLSPSRFLPFSLFIFSGFNSFSEVLLSPTRSSTWIFFTHVGQLLTIENRMIFMYEIRMAVVRVVSAAAGLSDGVDRGNERGVPQAVSCGVLCGPVPVARSAAVRVGRAHLRAAAPARLAEHRSRVAPAGSEHSFHRSYSIPFPLYSLLIPFRISSFIWTKWKWIFIQCYGSVIVLNF